MKDEMVKTAKVVGLDFPEIHLILNPEIPYPRGFLQDLAENLQDWLNAEYLVNLAAAKVGQDPFRKKSMVAATFKILRGKRT